MAVEPLLSTFTRRSILLTLPLTLCAGAPIRADIFLSTQCPISNRYIPELNRLYAEFNGAGVQFTGWCPEPFLDAPRLDRWAKDYAIAFPVALDHEGRRAKTAGVTMTPEAAVFSGSRLIYRGRIDDTFVSWGKRKPHASRKDLEEILNQLISGKLPPFRATKAWGCVIERGTGR